MERLRNAQGRGWLAGSVPSTGGGTGSISAGGSSGERWMNLGGGGAFAGRSGAGLAGAFAVDLGPSLDATFSIGACTASALCAVAGGGLSFVVIAVSPHELSATKTKAEVITRTIGLLASQFDAEIPYSIVKKVFDRHQIAS